MGLKPLLNKLVCLMGTPHRYLNHVDRGGRVTFPEVVAVEVPDQAADLQARNGLALDLLDQPLVNVELLLPLNLLVHHCPCRCELVIDDDDAAVNLLLNVNGSTDLDPINFNEQALFSDVAGSLPPLHNHMKGRTQHGPQLIRHIRFHLCIVLFAQTAYAWRRQKLSDAVLCIALAVVFTGSQRHQWCRHSVLVCNLHQDTS